MMHTDAADPVSSQTCSNHTGWTWSNHPVHLLSIPPTNCASFICSSRCPYSWQHTKEVSGFSTGILLSVLLQSALWHFGDHVCRENTLSLVQCLDWFGQSRCLNVISHFLFTEQQHLDSPLKWCQQRTQSRKSLIHPLPISHLALFIFIAQAIMSSGHRRPIRDNLPPPNKKDLIFCANTLLSVGLELHTSGAKGKSFLGVETLRVALPFPPPLLLSPSAFLWPTASAFDFFFKATLGWRWMTQVISLSSSPITNKSDSLPN